MRKTLVMILAGAALLSAGMLESRAGAMPRAVLGATAANATVVQQATNVCGSNGCVRVQTQRVRHHRVSHR